MNLPDPTEQREAAKARKIIDYGQLHQITEKLFAKLPIHIIENNQKNSVRALGYTHPYLEIMHQMPPASVRTLLLLKDDHSMMLECSVNERTERGTEIVKPLRLFLSKREIRHENRVGVAAALVGQIRNAIVPQEFYRMNAESNPTRDALCKRYAAALSGVISDAKISIELQKNARPSVRMKKLQDFNLPIFAPDMMRERQGDEQTVVAMPYSEYVQVMRADGLPGDFMGEICEPIRYRDAFIVGYVQVLSWRVELSVMQYHSTRQLVRRLEKDLEQKRCFPENTVTAKILDVSHSGIGFLYTGPRASITSAGIGDRLIFDAHFAADNMATFCGKIMNVASLENGRRYGIELENLSEAGQKALSLVIEGA